MIRNRWWLLLAASACCNVHAESIIDGAAIADESRTGDWLSYGRDYSEQRFVPLSQIKPDNVGKLGLAWSLDLPGIKSLQATPLAVDGTIYFSGNDSIVFAVDARSGQLKWRYDPEVWKHAGKRYRLLFPANRGVAYWKGRVYVGTYDGRLIAVDAATGKESWAVQTLEGETGYITGAPRAYNDKIIIGNGGAEAGYSRGYATAYDAATGKRIWRFYITPGEPAKGFENAAMAMAAKTWKGEWWKFGGGGTVWNSITYDPEFNRIYLGTGNGGPWNQNVRSPGGGDNLFLSSIVALDADTGAYAWHYQTTPGESWDYNSSQDIVLATLKWQGRNRKVILHAPKNGFFYVIDRSDGKLLAADAFGKVTWATHVDIESGRPVETPEARFPGGAGLLYPSSVGVHDWQAMSFNPQTGLVYIPTVDMPQYYSQKNMDPRSWVEKPFFYNTGYDVIEVEGLGQIRLSASLIAWDPIAKRKVWETPMPGLWNGGTVTTAGDLVFQGNAAGEFAAYHARTGKKLWSFDAGLGIVGAPISYQIDGQQYVAILVGWGGALPGAFGVGVARHGWVYGAQPRRLLVFALGRKSVLPPTVKAPMPIPLDDTKLTIDKPLATAGQQLFNTSCHLCHGFMAISGGGAPDLRASPLMLSPDALRSVLQDGALASRGMPQFDDLSDEQIRSLYFYVRDRARSDLARHKAEPAGDTVLPTGS
ncbi:MAG: PQQ-dependent dehydrogenase, methanol/ethanol family [Hydrocarboniphaga sp.]|uniref:PQQ-dependent dehydrogenase, methanol/ethanol family n=1 Tax=Hydrocarboniphaga sp. TaxID=2033016 RepID=UPI0026182812|nr:PQQ-dependent dehydrogenase, methanol/ethanol family [Hydrocarboniphaga sp.]MDB5968399.1 PQQ-dependent dehydrogenase, methanol/ethanol family [Hydrocarboniphaga sp.]